MLFVGTSIIHPSTEGVFLLCNILDLLIYSCKVNIRANLKNYDNEIDKFLHWLAPYIDTEGFIGYTRYEEYDDPTLIYIDDRDVIYKGVE